MSLLSPGLVFGLLFLLPTTLPAQTDPIADSIKVISNGGREEIVGGRYGGSLTVSKYFKALEYGPHDTLVQVLEYTPDFLSGPGLCGALTGNFDTDPLPEIAGLWVSAGRDSLGIMLLKPAAASLSTPGVARWSKTTHALQSTPPPFIGGPKYRGVDAHIVEGDFDGDSLKELIVAYWANVGSGTPHVNLTLYDVGDSLTLNRKASIADFALPVPPKELSSAEQIVQGGYFNIAAGDFDGDGKDEIILVARVPHAPTGRAVVGCIYSYDASVPKFTLRSTDTLFVSSDTLFEASSLFVVAGHLATTSHDDAFVQFQLSSPENSLDTLSICMATLGTKDGLDSLLTYQEFCGYKDLANDWLMSYPNPSGFDINGDGLLEIDCPVIAGKFDRVYRVATDHTCSVVTSFAPGLSSLVGTMGDFRADSTAAEAITLGDYVSGGYAAAVYALEPTAGGVTLGPLRASTVTPWILAHADLDGDLRLGSPKKFQLTQILQPLIILNAPPIHFDMFNDSSFDVSNCYPNGGKFTASYSTQSENTKAVEVKINNDWGYSFKATLGYDFWGFKVSSHFSETVGKKFSLTSGATQTISVTETAQALVDDKIYATVLDYDLWEYPILMNGTHNGDFLVVEPKLIENRWFPSKSWSGYTYIPNHEVGNILSYKEYASISDNPAVGGAVKWLTSDRKGLDNNSSYDWYLKFTDFSSQGSDTSWETSDEWGASVDAWGSGIDLSGHYSHGVINTQKTDVSSGLSISVHLDALDFSVGEVGYNVLPYAYWGTNGALVVDYAVQPEVAAQGGTPTWWQVRYGSKSDPAFILPWRLDPEKGSPLEDPEKRRQTKDITVTPMNALPGATVAIRAFVHNFSLIPTPHPVGVRFYLGNPDSGGVLIADPHGTTEVYTHLAIPARGYDTVSMSWALPPTIGSFGRIYGVLDAGASVSEVHLENNVGWNIFTTASGTNGVRSTATLEPMEYRLEQNYPNPFNPVTTIGYTVPGASSVKMVVYDLLGRQVQTLVDEVKQRGSYQATFNGQRLASGVYFCRLQAGSFVALRKLCLLR